MLNYHAWLSAERFKACLVLLQRAYPPAPVILLKKVRLCSDYLFNMPCWLVPKLLRCARWHERPPSHVVDSLFPATGVEKLAPHTGKDASVAVAVDANDSKKRARLSHNVGPIPTFEAAEAHQVLVPGWSCTGAFVAAERLVDFLFVV